MSFIGFCKRLKYSFRVYCVISSCLSLSSGPSNSFYPEDYSDLCSSNSSHSLFIDAATNDEIHSATSFCQIFDMSDFAFFRVKIPFLFICSTFQSGRNRSGGSCKWGTVDGFDSGCHGPTKASSSLPSMSFSLNICCCECRDSLEGLHFSSLMIVSSFNLDINLSSLYARWYGHCF